MNSSQKSIKSPLTQDGSLSSKSSHNQKIVLRTWEDGEKELRETMFVVKKSTFRNQF